MNSAVIRESDATPVPRPSQLRWQGAGFGLFFHFGTNTVINGVEWSDGTLPAASFDPSDCDPRQWVETAVAAGARYAVLTAKHHDGASAGADAHHRRLGGLFAVEKGTG